MTKYTHIQSKDNALVKHLVRLGQSSTYRQNNGLSVIYGLHVVEEAHKFALLDSLIVESGSVAKYQKLINSLSPATKIYTTDALIMRKFNLSDSSIELVGLVHLNSTTLLQETYTKDCLVLENIQDPGNLGTIMRSAAACGFKDIILSLGCVDAYNPKVFRASQGVQFGLTIYSAVDLEQFLISYTGRIVGTMPDAHATIYQVNLTNKPMAWVFGNEGSGLSPRLLALIKEQLCIPMQKNIESLNVAMAATICLFETYRQRLTAC